MLVKIYLKKSLIPWAIQHVIFLNFVQSFGNKLKLRDVVKIGMVEDRVQDLDSVSCGIFQMYFYDNLFNPDQNSKIQNKKTT